MEGIPTFPHPYTSNVRCSNLYRMISDKNSLTGFGMTAGEV